ncbi:hypothetical protein MNBD_ALPHA12-157, partial [hydrothermal vent metagenome]
ASVGCDGGGNKERVPGTGAQATNGGGILFFLAGRTDKTMTG